MKASRALVGAAVVALTQIACGGGGTAMTSTEMATAQGSPASSAAAPNIAPPWLGAISTKHYDGQSDDLLTAGLGATGLAFLAPAPLPATNPPTAAELRRLAIYVNYRALVDTTAGGGYGTFYGPSVGAPPGAVDGKIAGTEYIAFAALGNARENVTLMVQVPDSFDPAKACIVTGTSSGSRGLYGAIGTSGEWGLKHGCAVAYADKGSGLGVHDLQNDTVGLIDGTRTSATAAGANSNFTANITAQQRQDFLAATPNRIAVKHAHSEQNPQKDWGRDTLRAIEFAFYVLNETLGSALPSGKKSQVITPANAIVIASSVSNGAGAALAAAEEDKFGLIDGVAVSEPVIQVGPKTPPMIRRGTLTYTGGSRPLYDYFTYATLYQPCAALSPRAAGIAAGAVNAVLAANRCASLAAKGLLASATLAERAEEALDKLLAYGWEPDTNVLQPSHYSFATPSIAMTYSNAHGRFSVLDNLCGLSFAFTDPVATLPGTNPPVPNPNFGRVIAPSTAALATIFSTGNGVPPMAGINIVNNASVGGPILESISVSPSTGITDFNIDGALCQRELITGNSPNAQRVQLGVKELEKSGDLRGKPAIIVHGRADTLIPVNFNSRPYYAQNALAEKGASRLRYIEVTNGQHFEAFLPFPDYAARFIPLHVYFNRALDAMYAHLASGTPLPPSQVVRTTPRGSAAISIAPANVPPFSANPGSDAITFDGTTLTIPD
jgi:hydroxybutyrate-dimer hydrolase